MCVCTWKAGHSGLKVLSEGLCAVDLDEVWALCGACAAWTWEEQEGDHLLPSLRTLSWGFTSVLTRSRLREPLCQCALQVCVNLPQMGHEHPLSCSQYLILSLFSPSTFFFKVKPPFRF